MRNNRADRREKTIDGRLRVHAWTPRGFLNAGLLELDEEGERISATFEYDPAYLSAAGAFPLDPLNLPLGRTTWATRSQFVALGAIFDAAPDAWGRRVVAAQLPDEARQHVFRGAFLRGADGIGALVLTPESLPETDLTRIVELSLAERPGLSQIERAAQAASDFESGQDLTDEIRTMLAGSWTIGGARPKAIIRDDRPGAASGASLVAKFDSKLDALPRNRLEAASLAMARAMGFPVPASELIELRSGGSALLLERFDRRLIEGRMHRLHYISAMSLASYEPQSRTLDSRQDRAIISWSKLLELSSRSCAYPAAARVEMFGRLLLNAALGNSDDHLKNFGFLKIPGSATQYSIAPVFDVSPQTAPRHYLHCLDLGQVYTVAEVIPRCRDLGIAKGAAQEIEDRIMAVLCRRNDFLEAAGLRGPQIEQISRSIAASCGPRYQDRLGPIHPSDLKEVEDRAPEPQP